MVIFSVYTVQNFEIISTMNARASNRLCEPLKTTRVDQCGDLFIYSSYQ